MAIPEHFIEELKARIDIVDLISGYLPLTRKGANHWGLCPFHGEKTPSFSVSQEKQFYHCFGCRKGGGVVQFVSEMEHVSYPEAVRLLAERAGLSMPDEAEEQRAWRNKRARLLALTKDAARFYYDTLQRGGAAADYLDRRRILPQYARQFGLGAAPDGWDGLLKAMTAKGYDKTELMETGLAVAGKNGGLYDKFRNRLMLPVIDVRGDVLGFTSRVLDDNDAPKYLNTPETSLFRKRGILYGMNLAKSSRAGYLLLVEGNLDVITLHQAGFDNAVATMGTALTTEHVQLIGRYVKELVLCYDNDGAGVEATERAMAVLRNTDFSVKVLQLPRRRTDSGELIKQDPDDFLKAHGAGAFRRLLDGSENQVAYRLGTIRAKYTLESDEARAAFLQEAAEMIAGLYSPVEREIYATRAAREAEFSPDAMLREVERRRKQMAARARKQEERQARAPAQLLQPKARELRYRNVRSARAEEGLLRLVFLEPALVGRLDTLNVEDFSVPLFGKIFGIISERARRGRETAVAHLEEHLTPEELGHLTGILSGEENLSAADTALSDYLRILKEESARAAVTSDEALLDIRNSLKKKQQIGG